MKTVLSVLHRARGRPSAGRLRQPSRLSAEHILVKIVADRGRRCRTRRTRYTQTVGISFSKPTMNFNYNRDLDQNVNVPLSAFTVTVDDVAVDFIFTL